MANVRDYKNLRLIFFIFGVLFSSVLVNVFLGKQYDLLFLDLNCVDIYECNNCYKNDIYIYVLIKRIKQLIIFAILLRAFNEKYVGLGIWLIFGICFGSMITVHSYYEGIEGIILLLLFLIPHYFIYLWIVDIFVCQKSKSKAEGTYRRFVVLIALLFIIGILCEQFISKFFLLEYYQHIVTKNS